MRAAAILLIAATVLTCGYGGQYTLSGISPTEDAYTKASQTLMGLGYAIVSGDRDAGFLRAEKHAGSHGVAKQVQVITVNFVDVNFSVTGTTDYLPLSGGRKPDMMSNIVKADVEELRKALEGS